MISECNLLPDRRGRGNSQKDLKKEIWTVGFSYSQRKMKDRAEWRHVVHWSMAHAAVGVTGHNSSQIENVIRVVYGYPTCILLFYFALSSLFLIVIFDV